MSATDLAAVVVAIASVVGVMLLLFALVAFTRTLRAVRASVDDIHTRLAGALDDARRATVRAADDLERVEGQLERVDGVLAAAESVSATVDATARLAYLALSNPVIKVLAAASGTARAARRLRRR